MHSDCNSDWRRAAVPTSASAFAFALSAIDLAASNSFCRRSIAEEKFFSRCAATASSALRSSLHVASLRRAVSCRSFTCVWSSFSRPASRLRCWCASSACLRERSTASASCLRSCSAAATALTSASVARDAAARAAASWSTVCCSRIRISAWLVRSASSDVVRSMHVSQLTLPS
eukprot:scaffold140867_cov31-Tisochrysis_lutea.AAC.4